LQELEFFHRYLQTHHSSDDSISSLNFNTAVNINENIQKPVEEKPQKIVLDVKSVYDSLNIKNKILNLYEWR